MVNTVIFDMDGVIVNTEPIHEYSFFTHFKQLGLSISQQEYDTFRGSSTKNVYQRIKSEYNVGKEIDTLVNEKRAIFFDLLKNNKNLDLIDGVKSLIENLYYNKFQLILATSSARVTQTQIFNRFGLESYFSYVVSGEDFPQSKPDPAIFLKAVELSGQPKENCIIIEDSKNGVIAANKAEVFCVGYKGKEAKEQDLSLANITVHHFNELTIAKIKNFKIL